MSSSSSGRKTCGCETRSVPVHFPLTIFGFELSYYLTCCSLHAHQPSCEIADSSMFAFCVIHVVCCINLMCRSSMFAQCVIHVVTFLHESDVLLVLVQSVNHVEPQCCGDLSWLGDCSNCLGICSNCLGNCSNCLGHCSNSLDKCSNCLSNCSNDLSDCGDCLGECRLCQEHSYQVEW